MTTEEMLKLADKLQAYAHGMFSAAEAGLILEAAKVVRLSAQADVRAATIDPKWKNADLSEPPFAYRFEYSDKSGFEVMEDGTTFLTWPDGRREEKRGKITSNIRRLIGRAVILRALSVQPIPDDQRATEDMTLARNVREATVKECAKVATQAAKRCVREQMPGNSVAAYIERQILALSDAKQPEGK